MRKKFLHHTALQWRHNSIEIIDDLFLSRFEIMSNDFLLVHLIILCLIDTIAGDQVFEDTAGTFSIDIGNCSGQFDVCSFEHLLKSVKFPGSFTDKALAVTYQFAELPLILIRDIAWLKKTVLKKIRNPFCILNIRLPSRHCLHMAGIDHHGVQIGRFENVIKRFPIRGCAFHCCHLAAIFLEPVSQHKKFSGCCTKLTYLMFVAFS